MTAAESNTPDVAEKLRSLKLAPLSPDVPYRLESLFPRLTGWGANSEIKAKHKLITFVEPTLQDMLKTGEEVLYVAKGVQNSFIEQYFLGVWWAALINQTVFVLTNVRVILIHSNTKGKPHGMFWMIYYSQFAKFSANWFGTVTVKLKDKKAFTFTGFSKSDRKQITEIWQKALDDYQARGFDPAVTQSRENLCPHCFARVPKGDYDCPSCGADFWVPSAVALRSLLFPSWGDFIMKHYMLAVMELIGYGISWIVAIAIINSEPDPLIPVFAIGAIILLVHVPDAFLTYMIARKGLVQRRGPGAREVVDQLDDVDDGLEPA